MDPTHDSPLLDGAPLTPRETALLAVIRDSAYLAVLVKYGEGSDSDPEYNAGTLLDTIRALGPAGQAVVREARRKARAETAYLEAEAAGAEDDFDADVVDYADIDEEEAAAV